MLSRTKTHVRREKSSEKSINGQWCPLSAICRLKTHRFRHIFHCPQYSDLSDKKSLTCETVPLSVKPLKVPDALAELDGKTVAFEVERTVKSRRRYQEVVSGYLFNRKANGIDEIWYICPDRATQVRVQRAILSVDEIVNPQTGEARKTAELDRERLFACFKFMTTE